MFMHSNKTKEISVNLLHLFSFKSIRISGMLFKAAFGFRSACSLCFPQSWHTSTRRHPLLLYAEELWPLLCPPAEAGCCCRTNLQSHRFQELQDVLLNSNNSLWPACCSAYHHLQFSAAALIYIHVLLVWKLWKWAGRVNVWIFPPSFKSVLNVIFLAVLNHLQMQTKVHQLKRDEQFDLMWSEVKRDETLTTTDGFNVCTLQRRCSVKCSCTFSLPVKHFVSPGNVTADLAWSVWFHRFFRFVSGA